MPLSLAFLALAMLLLGLLEGSRYDGLKADAWDLTNLAAESLFAGYQPFLLENYQMFFLDGSFGTGTWNIEAAENEMEALLNENLGTESITGGMNFYCMNVNSLEVTDYVLAADQNGKVFEAHAAKAMKKTLGQKAAKKILNRIQNVEEKKEEAPDPEDSIKNADEALTELKKAKEEAEANKTESEEDNKTLEDTKEPQITENPLDTIKKLKKQGILTLVLPQGKSVSTKSVSVDNCLLKRKLQKGTYAPAANLGWYERILMQEFVKPYAGNAVKPNKDAVLSYGTEYLICGKGSDEENLKSTVKKLLAMREAVNFLYLQTDAGKSAEAYAAAVAIAGVTVNPVIITLVKQGILGAWAYAESICDVKALLAGGNIPLLKNAANWKTQLTNLGESALQETKGESDGLSYENYLDVLLYQKSVNQIAYRSMDLMEWNMQKEDLYKKCRMDEMIVGLKLTAEYDASPLFAEIFGDANWPDYQFVEKTEYVYD